MKAQELGFKIENDTPELKSILAKIKELEHAGFEFEAAEGSLALLIRKILKKKEATLHRRGVSRLHAPQRRRFRLRSDGESKSRRGPIPSSSRRPTSPACSRWAMC
jgi:hypothetical protein